MKIDKRTKIGKELLEDIQYRTRMSKWEIRDLRRLVAKITLDEDRIVREKQAECIRCYYRTFLASANMPEFECGICHETKIWHHGKTPKYCRECGVDNKICCYCGSELYGDWEV